MIKLNSFFLYLYIFSLFFFNNLPGLNSISNFFSFSYLILSFIEITQKKHNLLYFKEYNNYIYLFFLFICLSIIGVPFSPNITDSIRFTFTLFFNFLMSFFIMKSLTSVREIENIMKFISIMGFFSSALLLTEALIFNFDGISRIGELLGGINRVALLNSISLLFNIYLLINNKNNKIIFFAKLFSIIIILIYVLLSGSRNALIFIFITALIYSFYPTGKISLLYISKIILLSSVGLLLIYLVFEIPLLYSIIGVRIESLFSYITTGEVIMEKSLIERTQMFDFGLSLIWKKPFFGYGANSYRFFYQLIFGRLVYSHSDFIEITVGFGFIGYLLFIGIYLSTFIELYKLKSKKNNLKLLFLGLITAFFLTSFTTVHYYLKIFHFFIALISTYINLNKINIIK